MKAPWLTLFCIVIFIPGYAIDSDSLQQILSDRYAQNYNPGSQSISEVRASLIKTAAITFSPERMMIAAPEIYMTGEDNDIAVLIDSAMSRFFRKRFLQVSCPHYEAGMEQILAVYSDGLCDHVTKSLSAKGLLALQVSDKELEELLSDASLAQAKSESFKNKAAEMRADHGQDMILHSLGCSSLYMFKGCDHLRSLVIKQSITKALEERKEYISLQEKLFYAAFDSAIINGNYELLNPYINTSSATSIKKRTAKLHDAVSTQQHGSVYSVATSKQNNMIIIYRSKAGTRGILGGLQIQDSWVDGRRAIKSVRYISPKKVKAVED